LKKIFVTFIAILVAASIILTFGCSKKKSNYIGIAMPETHVERWVKDGASLKTDAEAKGYKADVTYGDADQAKENQQIQDMLTKGASLLIIANINEGVNPVVADAAKGKVPVIAYDRMITGTDQYDYYITFDNFQVGVFQGKAIETALDLANASKDKPKNITLFSGSPTDNNAKVFFDGAMSILAPYVESGVVKLIGPAPLKSSDASWMSITTEGWKAEVAKARMENLLNKDASKVVLDAILAPNDTLSRAIQEACSQDAKYVKKLPVITGQDGEVASIAAIRDGKQNMTVFKDTRQLAAAAIELADAILKGKTPDIKGARLDTDSYDTGKKKVKAFLLEPINVTKDNWKEVMVDSGYYKAEDIK
jgi:putative multiple sugar transport system substrate-binding protein